MPYRIELSYDALALSRGAAECDVVLKAHCLELSGSGAGQTTKPASGTVKFTRGNETLQEGLPTDGDGNVTLKIAVPLTDTSQSFRIDAAFRSAGEAPEVATTYDRIDVPPLPQREPHGTGARTKNTQHLFVLVY